MKYSLRIDRAVERFRRAGVDIRAIRESPWVVEIEARIGGIFPEAYRNLITRYSFPVLDLGTIELFSNLGDASADEITCAPFRDPILSRWLVEQGYFHFARLTTDHYDPVCLSVQQKTLAIAQFDHEAILQGKEIVPRLQLAETFLELLEREPLDA